MKIDLTVEKERRQRAIKRVRERNIVVPTFAQMKNPGLAPAVVKEKLGMVGLWDVNPLNLFRITWKNQPAAQGGGYDDVNFIEFPSSLTGTDARVIAMIGKWFPTGAHKVVWPSTGNFCRGGAYDSALLGCQSIAILPEGMSGERFEWLERIAGEVIATPGTESNVKEIFDKCWELRRSGQDLMIFNQFEEFGNHLWHYDVTGHAMEEVLQRALEGGASYHGVALTTGSAGTIGSGDYLKEVFPHSKLGASEA